MQALNSSLRPDEDSEGRGAVDIAEVEVESKLEGGVGRGIGGVVSEASSTYSSSSPAASAITTSALFVVKVGYELFLFFLILLYRYFYLLSTQTPNLVSSGAAFQHSTDSA